jgi:hypothetical protein
MEIKILDRIEEAKKVYIDAVNELNDYKIIQITINGLATYKSNPDKYPTTKSEDVDMLISKLYNLCQKHEIVLPDFIEWGSIELT